MDKKTGKSSGSGHIASADFDGMGMKINHIILSSGDSVKIFNVKKADATADIAK